MGNNMVGTGRGWGWDMGGRMGTATGLAGWGGDGDDFHPHAGLYSESEVHKILSSCPNKQSDSDLIPTWLLKECSSVLVPTISNIVNLSLTTGQFHPTLKQSIISPLLKKPTLDKEELSNYRQSQICLSFPK